MRLSAERGQRKQWPGHVYRGRLHVSRQPDLTAPPAFVRFQRDGSSIPRSISHRLPPLCVLSSFAMVFPFPVHWPELGVDLGLDYCHPLLIYHWPELGVDLGLDHWHQPLPGSLMKQTSLFTSKLHYVIYIVRLCL